MRTVHNGGTVESDAGETPRQGAYRETAEELGLDRPVGRLLVVDWVPSTARPPLVAYLYDGGTLAPGETDLIRLQEEELLSWRFFAADEIPAALPGATGRRVLAGLRALAEDEGPYELENGHPAGSA